VRWMAPLTAEGRNHGNLRGRVLLAGNRRGAGPGRPHSRHPAPSGHGSVETPCPISGLHPGPIRRLGPVLVRGTVGGTRGRRKRVGGGPVRSHRGGGAYRICRCTDMMASPRTWAAEMTVRSSARSCGATACARPRLADLPACRRHADLVGDRRHAPVGRRSISGPLPRPWARRPGYSWPLQAVEVGQGVGKVFQADVRPGDTPVMCR
jgi:hypothetical protein